MKNVTDKLYVQYYLLNSIDKLVSRCEDQSLQTLGVYISIGGLSTVCKEAKKEYPHISFTFMGE